MREVWVRSVRKYGVLLATYTAGYLVRLDGEQAPRMFDKTDVEIFGRHPG